MNRRNLLLLGASAIAIGGTVYYRRSIGGMDHGAMAGMDMGKNMPAAFQPRIKTLSQGAPLKELSLAPNGSSAAQTFETTIEASESELEFVPGLKTKTLTYNGLTPGPVIAVDEGERVKVNFINRVPGEESTIHWHGVEVPADQDGNPMDPIASGADRLYEFAIPMGTAGSYWYHPHAHGVTGEQVYRGLAAPFIVRSKADPLPKELGDTILMISALSLNVDGTVAENTPADLMNGREGDHVLVNGSPFPVLTLQPGESRRFRVYNATNGRYLRLAVADHTMTLVGTDGGLIPSPVKGLQEIVLSPAERVEIVINFQTSAGVVELVSLPYERGWMGVDKPAAATLPLLQFKLEGAVKVPVPLPASLRKIDALGPPAVQKRLVFGEKMGMANGGMTMEFLIDGKSFDMARVDLQMRLGDVEQWEIYNGTDMDHPFHIHRTQFQIVEREMNGKIVAAEFLSWKDTVNLTRKETVRFKVRQTMPGKRMYHCHILEHEGAGMMGVLNVA